MELSRRHAIVGVAIALAGCSGVESEIEERAASVRSLRGHPLSGTTTVSVVDRSGQTNDIERLTTEALAYWTSNAAEYAGFEVAFELTTESPDIELVFLGSRSELQGCREHRGREVLGCAPLLTEGTRPERPVTIEIVAGDRPESAIRTTVKHELGHALGLGHDDEPARIMSNDIEDRLPEYARRTEILENIENGWNSRNAGTRRYNRAIDRWNDGEYGAAATGFESAAERYRSAVAAIDTAAELEAGFDGMARPETVDRELLRRYLERSRRWIDLAITRSDRMAAAATAYGRGNPSIAQDHVAAAKAATETLRTAVFPAPADVARALGLIRDGRTDETATEPETVSGLFGR